MIARSIGVTDGLTLRTIITCVLVASAIVLGGGGSSAPLSELWLELVMAAGAGLWFVFPRTADRSCSRVAVLISIVILALPVLQLLPLPPELWRNLPGRALEAAGTDLAGSGRWMAWTMSPPRTRASLLAMIPAVFVLCAASCLDRRGRRTLLMTIAALGLVSLLLGALQLGDGTGRSFRFYPDNPGFLNGFQANRNAEVDVLLIALAAFTGVVMPRGAKQNVPAWPDALAIAVAALLLLGCVLTGSRAGILIAVPVAAMLAWHLRPRVTERRRTLVAIALLVALSVSAALIHSSSALRQVADRFSWQHDVRADLWRDTLPVVRSVWPAGGGIGTFRPLFVATEPLTSVDPTRPVRAHNDYLEFILEAGLAAIAVLSACMIVLGTTLVRAARCAGERDRSSIIFAATTFIVIALHSLVDYPLRSMALAVLGAAAAGMVIAVLRDADRQDRTREPGLESSRG